MKNFYIILLLFILSAKTVYSYDFQPNKLFSNDVRAVKSLLRSQVRYANKENFDKFISTYDLNYTNADGLTYENYSNLVKEIWQTYDKIKYDVKIDDIVVNGDKAVVKLTEYSYADIPVTKKMEGTMKSVSDSEYQLKKVDGKWKVVYDTVNAESTSMLYGDARKLNIKLTAPQKVVAGTEYTSSLEFISPIGTVAIASIAKDKIEYPQTQPKEVYRKMPDDNILERLFVANSDNKNEYIVATIGLTKADVSDLSFKISLNGFGYYITRVNVIPNKEASGVNNVDKK